LTGIADEMVVMIAMRILANIELGLTIITMHTVNQTVSHESIQGTINCGKTDIGKKGLVEFIFKLQR
jgi:hypothetical protein